MTNYLKVIVLLKEKTKKSDLKLEAEIIKTLPFLIYLEDNAIAIEEANRKSLHINYCHREVNQNKYLHKKNKQKTQHDTDFLLLWKQLFGHSADVFPLFKYWMKHLFFNCFKNIHSLRRNCLPFILSSLGCGDDQPHD